MTTIFSNLIHDYFINNMKNILYLIVKIFVILTNILTIIHIPNCFGPLFDLASEMIRFILFIPALLVLLAQFLLIAYCSIKLAIKESYHFTCIFMIIVHSISMVIYWVNLGINPIQAWVLPSFAFLHFIFLVNVCSLFIFYTEYKKIKAKIVF